MNSDELSSHKFSSVFFNKVLILSLLFFVAVFAGTYLTSSKAFNSRKESLATKEENQKVLGRYDTGPQIYVYSGEQQSAGGGMIALASTDEPAVYVSYYAAGQNSGSIGASIDVYKADTDTLLNYLTHDNAGKQIQATPDLNRLQFVTSVSDNISIGGSSKIILPLEEIGIWYLKVKIGSSNANAFVVRSNFGVLTTEGDNELIFWGQDYKTKRSIIGGDIKVLNLLNGKSELASSAFGSDGIAKAPISADADVALVSIGNDIAIVPINLKYLNTGYSYQPFQPKNNLTRYFIFTDRPLYKPGDTVNFKAVLRNDDDARYTIPSGEASVQIYDAYYYDGSTLQPVFQKNFPISADGTVTGQYQIPEDSKVGYQNLVVKIPNQSPRVNYMNYEWTSNSTSFDVEYYKKPEFSIGVDVPKTEFIAGDKTSFTVSGSYFSGQPLVGQKIKYVVNSADFYEYQYLTDQSSLFRGISNDYQYGLWSTSNKVIEGTATLDKKGEAKIDLNTKVDFNNGKSQVFSIDASLDDGSQTPSFSRRNILVYAGEYGIFRTDTSYGTKVGTELSLPVALVAYKGNANVGNINLTAKIHRKNWVSYQEANKKYLSYKIEEDDMPNITTKTNSSGNATLSFTPQKVGSYTITVEGKDARGNLVSKIFYSYVSADDQPQYSDTGSTSLTVAADKQMYKPSETAIFSIFSSIPDRDVFLDLERGRVERYQVVHMNGKNAQINVPITATDMPNVYAKVSSFSSFTLDTTSVNVPVSTDSKKLVVAIAPEGKTYGPGETVSINVSTTDTAGNPVSADVAVWAVDKALFELSDTKLGDIFQTFWNERYNTTQSAHSLEGILVNQSEGGGCFAAGTKILMADGSQRNIENVKSGDYVLTRTEGDSRLVKAKVLSTSKAVDDGYMILNGSLRVTPDHILWVNGEWQVAGNVQVGDNLASAQGGYVRVTSVEWQRGKTNVYNLEVEKYHTYIANGVWVHNQKGDVRQSFKDTAYWNPSVHTDSSGKAKVSFKLPDNLTTWTLAAVGSTLDTRVGQTTSEITVTKDIVVRPILPNILRTGDEITLSALVQNFTDKSHNFDIELKFDSGKVDKPQFNSLSIGAGSMQQLYWKVKPDKESNKAKLTFSAVSKDDSKLNDTIVQEIPVKPFGFEEKRAESGEDAKTYQVKLSPDSDKTKSSLVLSVAPTIIGTLPSAMKYLINYPYGCVEQITSSFVPAVIAKLNPGIFTEALKDKDITDIMAKGISKLASRQQSDGGWAWWSSGGSKPFVTTYVVQYLLQARKAGAKVDDATLLRATNYLGQDQYYDPKSQKSVDYSRDDWIVKNYGLNLLGHSEKMKKVTDLNNVTPDLLAIAVITNYVNGDTNSQSNGLDKLVSMAKTQGDGVYWDPGNNLNFGSIDASTGLAIRAIIVAGGDRELAVKAARYLTRNHKYDYWSNSFATSQVVRALTDLYKSEGESSPNYSYAVKLDGKQISAGTVTSAKQVIPEISIPVKDIKSDGSAIEIIKNGSGQIYSTLAINEFRTDRNASAVSSGLTIKRDYMEETTHRSSLAVGDTAIVRLTVSGLKANENYGVITDELPSGLVPINESFNNERYGQPADTYYTSFDVTDADVTENGMVLSLYQVARDQKTYTYRARVVSAGTFIVPPTTVSLMYAPEITGRTGVSVLKVADEPNAFFGSAKAIIELFARNKVAIVAGVFLLGIVGTALFVLKRKGIIMRKPPVAPPPGP